MKFYFIGDWGVIRAKFVKYIGSSMIRKILVIEKQRNRRVGSNCSAYV